MAVRTLISGALLVVASTTLALSQAATPIGSFKQWSAYTYTDAEGKSCYIASQPQSSKYSREISGRDPAFFLVTTRVSSDPAKTVRNEASTIIGYPFADNVKVTVEIDGATTFTMFTDKDSAWIENPAQEADLIAAMQKGNHMTVVGKSRRGTLTTDTYSLSGLTAALDAIAKECQ